jgi:UDP-2-acetamido-3-amino-2,3-dideoxy-glucuronate N-acetyltransferase
MIKNIGLIGAGYWGKNLVRVFAEMGSLKLVCDLNKKILDERKKENPSIETTTNYNDILKDKEIQGVVVAAPAFLHYKFTKQALLAGKNVFVEKPLALKVSEAKELVQISEKKKLVLMVGHLLLYHPAVNELKKIISKGILGDIRYIYSNRLNFGKLRTEENVLWSFAPHDVAVLLELLNTGKKKEVAIFATGKGYLQKKIPDFSMATFNFSDDKTGHIFVTWLNPTKEQKLVVVGSKKMAMFDDQTKQLLIYDHKVAWHGKVPEAVKGEGKIVKFPGKEPLKEEALHFLNCIKKNQKAISDGREGLAVLEVLNACQKSMDTNKVVKIKI